MAKKFYINTKRPNLKVNDPSLKESNMTFVDDTHGVHGKKPERFSELKKRLQKRTV